MNFESLKIWLSRSVFYTAFRVSGREDSEVTEYAVCSLSIWVIGEISEFQSCVEFKSKFLIFDKFEDSFDT